MVHGPTFTSGSDYRCKFGESIVGAVLAGDGNLTCTSPGQSTPEDVSVEVTLNGQQYSRSAVRFAYHTPEQVLRLSPSSGLITGSTIVRVLGSGFRPFEETLCRFGDFSVNATWVSTGEVQCVSHPAASAVHAADKLWLDFSDEADVLTTSELYTSGPHGPTVKNGALILTYAETNQKRSIVVRGPRMSSGPHMTAQSYFAASFDLYVGDGLGGEGVSVCLGELPNVHFGEEGVGEGLRVLLLTHVERLEVHYDDELILGRPVDRGHTLPSSMRSGA